MSPQALRWVMAGATDRGLRRKRNEDSMVTLPGPGIAVVADGMGGHPGGDVASLIAAQTAAETLRRTLGNGTADLQDATPAARERAMGLSVLSAHEAVVRGGFGRPELTGMGTTVTALALTSDGSAYTLGNVGDSRIYRYRAGALHQLTRDDTELEDAIDAGAIARHEARGRPEGHRLTQCLGLDPAPRPRVASGSVAARDVFLLCSDGLVACLTDDAIAAVLGHTLDGTGGGAERALRTLIAESNRAGGVDNITAIVVEIEAG